MSITKQNKLSATEGRNYQSKWMLSSIDLNNNSCTYKHNLLVDISCSVVAIAEI